jgi:hypothetical protein
MLSPAPASRSRAGVSGSRARSTAVTFVVATGLATWVAAGTSACSASDESAGGGITRIPSTSNAGAAGSAGGSVTKGGAGGAAAMGGASSANAGAGGTGINLGGSDQGGAAGQATCASEGAKADLVELPADIIWVVDQSGSMNQETAYVKEQINNFAADIAKSSVDYRVVMIANPTGSNAICVPPPLAGDKCGNAERFRLVAKTVSSTNGPSIALSEYAKYQDFLRPEATKHFVFVTDDNSKMSAADFLAGLQKLQPAGIFDDVKIHAVFAFGDNETTGCKGPFGSGAKFGSVYDSLVKTTGGAKGVICEDDWTKVFTDITTAVISGSKVSCELTVPPPPKGKTLDPDLVNVAYTKAEGEKPTTLVRVANAAACTAAGGWYYDNPTAPKFIELCPASCTEVQAQVGAKVDVQFGCASIVDIPK